MQGTVCGECAEQQAQELMGERPPGEGAGNPFVTKGKDRGFAQSRARVSWQRKQPLQRPGSIWEMRTSSPVGGEMGGGGGAVRSGEELTPLQLIMEISP